VLANQQVPWGRRPIPTKRTRSSATSRSWPSSMTPRCTARSPRGLMPAGVSRRSEMESTLKTLRPRPAPRCSTALGVSLHANVCIPARDRLRLERLCRYCARPASERLSLLPDGRLLYSLKHPWRDGTAHVVFEPLELVEKLAALVPPPRFNLVRYHGVLAPAARSRPQVVPV